MKCRVAFNNSFEKKLQNCKITLILQIMLEKPKFYCNTFKGKPAFV